jgi:hypothetical protein
VVRRATGFVGSGGDWRNASILSVTARACAAPAFAASNTLHCRAYRLDPLDGEGTAYHAAQPRMLRIVLADEAEVRGGAVVVPGALGLGKLGAAKSTLSRGSASSSFCSA